MIEGEDSDHARILLLGTLGHGKTRLVNSLCGTPFDSCMSSGSCTTTTQEGLSKKYNIQIIDTPGFFSSDSTEQHTIHQKDALENSLLCGVYLVIKYGRVPEMAATASKIMDFVGDDDIRILITFVDSGRVSKEEEIEAVLELGKLVEVKTESIKAVGLHTAANDIEDFIESTLHYPRQFKTNADQQAYVNTLHVGAKKLFNAVDSICTVSKVCKHLKGKEKTRKAKDVRALQTEILDEAAAFSAEDKVVLIQKLEDSYQSSVSADPTDHYTLNVLSSIIDQTKGIPRSTKRKTRSAESYSRYPVAFKGISRGQDNIATHTELPIIPSAKTIQSGDPANSADCPVVKKRETTEINSIEMTSRITVEPCPSRKQAMQSAHDFATLNETYSSPEEDIECGHYVALDDKHASRKQETQSDHDLAALEDSSPPREQEAQRYRYVVPEELHPSLVQEAEHDDHVSLHKLCAPREQDRRRDHYVGLDEKHCDVRKLPSYTGVCLDRSPTNRIDKATDNTLQHRTWTTGGLQKTQQPAVDVYSLDAMVCGEPIERGFNRLSIEEHEYQSPAVKRRRLCAMAAGAIAVVAVFVAVGRGWLTSGDFGSDLESDAELCGYS